MAFAIYHLHRVANTYHGDIKLDNIVLSTDDDAVLMTSSRRIMRKDVSPFWQMDFVSNTPTSRTDIDAPALSTIRYVRCTGPDRDDTWSAY